MIVKLVFLYLNSHEFVNQPPPLLTLQPTKDKPVVFRSVECDVSCHSSPPLSMKVIIWRCMQVVLATKADNTALAALREMVEKGGKVLPRSTSYKYL